MKEYVCFRRAESVSNHWLYQIELYLRDYLNYCNWNINKLNTIKYLNKIQNKYAVSSYRKQVFQIRLFLRYHDLDWLDKLKVVSEPDYTPKKITKQDIEELLGQFKGHKYELQARAIILLGISSGLRATELYRLKIKNIDINNRTIHFKSSKSGKARVSFFNKAAQKALKEYYEYVKTDRRLEALFGESHCSLMFRDKKLQIKDLRKAFSQEWTRRNGSSGVKKILMGHSLKGDVDLMHYNYQSEEDLKKVYDKVMN